MIRSTERAALVLSLLTSLAGCGADSAPENPAVDFKGIDADAMELSVNPCDDFYDFACGGFINGNLPTLGPGQFIARIDAAYFADRDLEQETLATSSGPAGDLVGSYASACEGASAVDQDRGALDELLGAIDAMATADDLPAVLARLHEVGASALFVLGSTEDLAHAGPRVAYLAPPSFPFSRSDYVDGKHDDLIEAYEIHVGTMASIAGTGAAADAKAVVAFETALARASLAADSTASPTTFPLTSISDVEKARPHLPLAAYFKAAGAPAFTEARVYGPEYFAPLDALLAGTSVGDLKAYLRFRALEAFADSLGATVLAEEDHFHHAVLFGSLLELDAKEYCLEQAESELPGLLGQAFVEALGSKDRGRASSAAALMQMTREAFAFRLLGEPWLDATTRAEAEKKVTAMRTEVYAPTSFPSSDGLVIDAASYPTAQAAIRTFYRKQSLASIGKKGDDPWFLPQYVFNAAYLNSVNAANVTAAFLQTPAFDASFDDVVNVGAMGSVMGHEMTHGFDDDGRLYDGSGVLHDWWSASTKRAFDERTKCLVDQYDHFVLTPSTMKVHGEQTLDENIADLGGLQVAYDELLPIEEDAKAFFIAYAQFHCEADTPEYLENLVDHDPHAPAKARVNAVVSNMPQFAAAFSCAEGTPMAPATRCSVW